MRVSCTILVGLAASGRALLEEKFVSFESADDAVSLHDAAVVYASDDPVGLQIAARSIVGDLEQITGNRPDLFGVNKGNLSEISNTGAGVIIAGTLESAVMKELVDAGKLEVSAIEGKWETFQTSVVERPFANVSKAFIILGSDKRAAMFGLYTLAEQCGQSPFHWWADVPAQKHDEIYAPQMVTIQGEPSVRYRGLMINDEAPGLTGWWSKIHDVDHKSLDSEFYEHVFDMLLRLKGNFMWPAMWKSFVPSPGNIFFTDDPRNMQLADDYGIVISTSHHEPMQRASNEWNETLTGPWNWETNTANVTDFMEEGVRRARVMMNESYFTLGMRGEGDSAIQSDDPVGVLEDVFRVQRDLLSRYYGNATAASQVWTIYKEVATYYAAGLVPPEDVTLMFTDDNWGNIQRLPLENETARSGGIGMYYHLQYLGNPKEYKWQNTNNLPKIYKELYQASERGVDRIWVINVGDIKPLEQPFNFIMELAWNTSRINFNTIPDYLEAFAAREFGQDPAEEIASIMMEQSRLVGRRKYESTQSDTYSILHYNENERVLSEWKSLEDRVLRVLSTLPEDRRDAFWHHVQYPVVAGSVYHATMLGLGRNQQIGFERRNSANELAERVLAAFDKDFDLLEAYDAMRGGKWAGILSQPHFDQYSQAIDNDWKEPTKNALTGLWYVQLRQNATYAFGNLGIYAEGCESAQLQGRSLPSADASGPTTQTPFMPVLPRMDPYGQGSWTVDLFHRGDYRVPIEWALDVPHEWVRASPASGTLDAERSEQRLNLSIDWAAVPEGLDEQVAVRIDFNTSPWFELIHLPIANYRVPGCFVGFPETAGLVSIEAPHYQAKSGPDSASESDGSSVTFAHIPHLGTRTTSGSLALRPYAGSRASPAKARSAWVDYNIYLYNDSRPLNASFYVNGALDTDPTLLMSYSLTLDDNNDDGGGGSGDGGGDDADWTRLLGDPATPGDTPPGWQTHVADHVWMRNVTFGNVTAGPHTLRWRTNSPEVYLEKIVLDTRGGVKSSYLGPPETRLLS
ncbi:hypothetical protein F4778DRAFT_767751 [Xylariomycetidae sp. FL2044]|nr:hypothetical protein F4778DRAFT_767751 [Xylariomycetidae sp. FL2044]